MDYYTCEKCGKIFDEFEMNYRLAQIDKKCWCDACRIVTASTEPQSPGQCIRTAYLVDGLED